MPEDIVRVLRVIEYVGPRQWVEETIARSVHGTKKIGPGEIRAATLGTYPEVLHAEVSEAPMENLLEPLVPPPVPPAGPAAAASVPDVAAPVRLDAPTPIMPDGSPCPGCGNVYIHAIEFQSNGQTQDCPYATGADALAREPRLTLKETE